MNIVVEVKVEVVMVLNPWSELVMDCNLIVNVLMLLEFGVVVVSVEVVVDMVDVRDLFGLLTLVMVRFWFLVT